MANSLRTVWRNAGQCNAEKREDKEGVMLKIHIIDDILALKTIKNVMLLILGILLLYITGLMVVVGFCRLR